MSDLPQFVARDAGTLFATWRNILIEYWFGEVTAERLRRGREPQRALVARYPGGFAVISVVTDKTALGMTSDAREEAVAQTKEFSPHYIANATVIEGTGFFAATARSVAVGLNLISRTQAPTKVFDSVERAVAWMLPLLNSRSAMLTEAQLLAAFGAARTPPLA